MVLAEYGTEDTYYLLGLDIIGQQGDGVWSYFGYDGLGSVRQVYDDLGAVGLTASYAPYGTVFESYGDLTTSFGFTGEYTDPIGMLFLRARYYNPGIGSFMSVDPVEGFVGGEAIRWNAYNYVGANPINYTDPSGEFWGIGAVIGGAIIGGAVSGIVAHQMYTMAERGDCGCELKDWAKNTNYYDFVNNAIGMGIGMGAAAGAMASLDPVSTAIAGFYMSGASAFAAAMKPGGLSNPCNMLEYMLGLGGMATSALGTVGSMSGASVSKSWSTRIPRYSYRQTQFAGPAGLFFGGPGYFAYAGVWVIGGTVTLNGGALASYLGAMSAFFSMGGPGGQDMMPVRSRIGEDKRLVKEADKLRGTRDEKDIERVIEQYRKGIPNPGRGTHPIQGVPGVSELRAWGLGRVYFRVVDGVMEILGVSTKTNQNRVIGIIRELINQGW